MSMHEPISRSTCLARRFHEVRQYSLALVEGLSAEDCQLQSMAEASPVKWHLAHTSWFFETFILSHLSATTAAFNPAFKVLFNSYYLGVGERHVRAERGMLSRPALEEVKAYRYHVDRRMQEAIESGALSDRLLDLVELGLNHEQQHQELILTDLKHHFSRNPLLPAWRARSEDGASGEQSKTGFIQLDGGLVDIGHTAMGFSFDNELPRHRVWLEPFELASRNVSNGDGIANRLEACSIDGDFARQVGGECFHFHFRNCLLQHATGDINFTRE